MAILCCWRVDFAPYSGYVVAVITARSYIHFFGHVIPLYYTPYLSIHLAHVARVITMCTVFTNVCYVTNFGHVVVVYDTWQHVIIAHAVSLWYPLLRLLRSWRIATCTA